MSRAKSEGRSTATREANRVAGVVLAAGAGTRYGMPKVLAGQGEWLRQAVGALSDGGCDDVVVVLGAAVIDVPSPARAVMAPNWADGMSASLRAGFGAIDAAFAVLHLVDTPDVGADVVTRVLAAAEPSGLSRATYAGRPGHPVVVARAHWSDLLSALRGDEGARAFLAGRDDVVAVECGDLATGGDVDERLREERDVDERLREERDVDERLREERDVDERLREERDVDERLREERDVDERLREERDVDER